MRSARWPLWGSYAFLAVSDTTLLAEARRVTVSLLEEVETACSRFRADSSLTKVNRRPGRWTRADPLLVAATRVAVAAADETGGLVAPCLGRSLVSLGYDRALAAVRSSAPPPMTAVPHCPPRPDAWRELAVTDDAIRLPAGVALDLGATAKAWAADLVAATLVDRLRCDVVVSLGGDVRVLGPGPESTARWPVQVAEHPDDVPRGPTVQVSGGLATSSTVVRRWRNRSGSQHHLLDPRTGAPVVEVFRTVSAAGRTCVAANTATTAALVLGPDALRWLAAHGVAARLVDADGSILTVGSWPAENSIAKEAS